MAWRDDEELGVIFKLQQEQMEISSLLKDSQEKHAEILELLRHTNEVASARRPS